MLAAERLEARAADAQHRLAAAPQLHDLETERKNEKLNAKKIFLVKKKVQQILETWKFRKTLEIYKEKNFF